jgi:hypothetical protein
VFPVKYELGFYIPEDGILHSHRRENLKSYTVLFLWQVMQCGLVARQGHFSVLKKE